MNSYLPKRIRNYWNSFPVVDDLVADSSSVNTLPDKLFSLGKNSRFSGLHLNKDHLIHFSFGKPVKDDEVHRSSEEPCIFGVVFKVREIRDQVFCDLAADYGFAFLYSVLTDFFLLVKFPGPKESVGFFGNLSFHLPRLPSFIQVSCAGFYPAFQFDVFDEQVHYKQGKEKDKG